MVSELEGGEGQHYYAIYAIKRIDKGFKCDDQCKRWLRPGRVSVTASDYIMRKLSRAYLKSGNVVELIAPSLKVIL